MTRDDHCILEILGACLDSAYSITCEGVGSYDAQTASLEAEIEAIENRCEVAEAALAVAMEAGKNAEQAFNDLHARAHESSAQGVDEVAANRDSLAAETIATVYNIATDGPTSSPTLNPTSSPSSAPTLKPTRQPTVKVRTTSVYTSPPSPRFFKILSSSHFSHRFELLPLSFIATFFVGVRLPERNAKRR